jgi:tetratricopeptide (TPR) repeat protein
MRTRGLAVALVIALAASAGAQAQTTQPLARRQAIERYRAGVELMTAERWEQAAEEFRAAIHLDPLLTLAHYNLGQSYMALRRYASAIQALIGCRTAYEQIGAMRQRDQAEAIRRQGDEINELRDSVRRMETSVKVNAGTAFRIQQRLEELETMRRGQNFVDAVPPVPAEVLLALGSAYYRNRQTADAEHAWLEAVRINSRLGEAHNNLAALYLQTGRKRDAQAAIQAAERTRFRVNPRLKTDIEALK